MKKRITSILFLAVALFCNCSQSDDFIAGDNNLTEATDGNVSVVFRLQSSQTSTTRSAEDSHSYIQGSADEYKVNNARVYLYDNQTKLFVKTFLLNNITRKGSDANGNIIYETEEVSVPQGTYDIFVTANTNRVISKDTENEFLSDIDRITYEKANIEDISGGIVMSNRASANVATVIADDDNDNENIVSVTVERVLARLDIAKSANEYKLTDNKGTQYATIKLDGYSIVNLAKYYYTFRHTAVLTSMTEPEWDINTNFGNIADVNGYVIDPYFFKKKIDATSFSNQDKFFENYYGDMANPNSIQWKSFNAVSSAPNYKTSYCLENCALAQSQKNGYSTGVVFRATIEPHNNVYRLNGSGQLEIINNPSEYPEELQFFDYRFFASPEALETYIRNTGASGEYHINKYEKTDDGYRCYYKYWIRHIDNYRTTEMGVMEFAVVRNNLYRMLITNISGIGDGGTGILNVSPDIPDEGEASIHVVLNVKPWIVRDLTDIVL